MGDDTLIGIKTIDLDEEQRSNFGHKFLRKFRDYCFCNFGVLINAEKSVVSTSLSVDYARPIHSSLSEDMSSTTLRGAKIFSSGVSYLTMAREPDPIPREVSHRWTYMFKGKPSF